jgi:hypothetical protein
MDPIRPQRRKMANGKLVFNKGYTPWNKGKTYKELFTPERMKAILDKMDAVRRKTKHNGFNVKCAKAIVVISNGKLIARFCSGREAARKVGTNRTSVSRYCTGRYKDVKRGWLWFFEEEDYKWAGLITD